MYTSATGRAASPFKIETINVCGVTSKNKKPYVTLTVKGRGKNVCMGEIVGFGPADVVADDTVTPFGVGDRCVYEGRIVTVFKLIYDRKGIFAIIDGNKKGANKNLIPVAELSSSD